MTPANIAWIISFILWLVFVIFNFIANRYQDTAFAEFTLILELVCLGFMWVFTGFTHGWW